MLVRGRSLSCAVLPEGWLAGQGGHDHVLSVPLSIGPLVLRVLLLSAVAVVTGFALMRVFMPEPSRTTVSFVAVSATLVVVVELLLADGLDIPAQTVVPLLMALSVPLFLALSRKPRPGRAVIRGFAPWVLSVAAVIACVEFARAWTGGGGQEARAMLLHTGLMLAATGLSWFTLCRPRSLRMKLLIQIEAALLATVVVAAAANAAVLRPPDPLTAAGSVCAQITMGAGPHLTAR